MGFHQAYNIVGEIIRAGAEKKGSRNLKTQEFPAMIANGSVWTCTQWNSTCLGAPLCSDYNTGCLQIRSAESLLFQGCKLHCNV